jgi:PAS domain S-box-containing protein
MTEPFHMQETPSRDLLRIQAELYTERERYFDFCDLAQAGFVTLSERAVIQHANLATAALLGVVREMLTQQPITRFILQTDQDIFHQYRQQLLQTRQPQACQLRMLKQDGTTFWVQLKAIAAQDAVGALELRMVLSHSGEQRQSET